MDKIQRRVVRPWYISFIFVFVFALSVQFNAAASDPCDGLAAAKQELELAKQSVKSFKELYERKDKEIVSLNAKINKLQDGFDSFQQISDRLTKEKESLQRQQSQLAAQLKTLEAQKIALERQNELLANCPKELKQKSLDIAALTGASKADQQDLAQKLRAAQGQLDAAMQSNKDLTRKNKSLQDQYSELSIKVALLEKNNTELTRQKELAVDKAQDLTKEIEIIKAKLMTAQTENARLKDATAKATGHEGAAIELERTKKELAQIKDENKKLGAAVLKVKNVEDLQQEAALLRNEAANLAKENKRLADIEVKYKAQENYSTQLVELRKKISQMSEENLKLNKDSAGAVREQQTCQGSLVVLRKELAARMQENEKLQREVGKAVELKAQQPELTEVRNKLAQLEKAKSQLWDAYSEKVKNQKGLIDELIELRVRIGQQRAQVGQLEEENRKLRASPDQAAPPNAQLEKLTKELALLEAENRKLRAAPAPAPVNPSGQDALSEELRQIREELGKTEAENKKLRGEIIALPARDKAMLEEVKSLRAEVADLKDENSKLRQNPLSQRQEGYDKGLATGLQRELDKTRKELMMLQIKNEQVEKENIQLKQTAALLKDQEVLDKEAATLREKLMRVEQERNQLRSEVGQARKQDGFIEGLKLGYEKESEKLRADLENVKAENRKCAEETARLKKFESSTQDVAEARRQIIKLSEEKQAVVLELDALKAKQDTVVDQLVKVRREKENLEESAKGKTGAQIARLQQDLKDAQALSYQMVQEKAAFQVKEKQLNNQIGSLESQLSQMEKTIAELNNKQDILKTEHTKLSDQLAQTMVKLAESEKERQAIALTTESTKREITDLRAQLAAAQDIASKMKDEMYQLRKTNADLTAENAKMVGQRAQESAIVSAQLEQLQAHKDGEIALLNQKFAQFRSEKELEIVAVSEKVNKLQEDLKSAQGVSLQLMQEKTGFSGQQKQLGDEYKRLQNQNTVMSGQIKKLEDQNAFLQNQFIAISQEANDLKRLAKGGQKGGQPQERYIEELQQLKSELVHKSEQLRLYEQSGGQGLSQQNKELIDDYTKLKKQFDALKTKNKELEDIKKQFEDFKSRSGKLPAENATLHYNLSVLYAQNQEYPKAIAELEKVIELKPDDGEAYYNLGVIYGEYLSNRKKAITYFKKYLSLSPKDADADRIRQYVLTYETFEQQ